MAIAVLIPVRGGFHSHMIQAPYSSCIVESWIVNG
jgi:hypothetical protein